jgi:hypothetical protein
MNDNARKWVEALRSGEFEQGRSRLRKGDQYCCLGVACELYRREHPDGPDWDDVEGEFAFDGCESMLPDVVRDWLELRTPDGDFGNGDHNTLTYMNDDGCTFEDIADVIESEPEGLFNE